MKTSQLVLKSIRAEMERRFWTQQQLARAASTSEATVSRLLAGRSVHPHAVQRVLKALELLDRVAVARVPAPLARRKESP